MAMIKPLHDSIICTDGDFGDQTTQSGIIIKSTIGKEEGVVPRWFKVFALGPKIDWLEEGQWVYVEFGRWTEGFKLQDDRLEEGQQVWKIDPKGCLAVSDEKPGDQINIKSSNGIEFAQKKTL